MGRLRFVERREELAHAATVDAETAEHAEYLWFCELGEFRVDCRGTHSGKRMTSQEVSVVNQLGMHARAAAKFVHLAARYQSRVKVARHGREMDGKSILGLLLLAAAKGSTITISADGADEQSAVEALVQLVQSGFGEDVCNV